MTEEQREGWNEHRKFVVDGINDLKQNDRDIYEKIGEVQRDVAGLKVKAGFFGLIGGAVVLILSLLPKLL